MTYTINSQNVKEKSFILYCLGVLYSFISPERFDINVECSLVTVYC